MARDRRLFQNILSVVYIAILIELLCIQDIISKHCSYHVYPKCEGLEPLGFDELMFDL